MTTKAKNIIAAIIIVIIIIVIMTWVNNTLTPPAPSTRPMTRLYIDGWDNYTVKGGDSLYGIIYNKYSSYPGMNNYYDTLVDMLASHNNMRRKDVLREGQIIKVPDASIGYYEEEK